MGKIFFSVFIPLLRTLIIYIRHIFGLLKTIIRARPEGPQYSLLLQIHMKGRNNLPSGTHVYDNYINIVNIKKWFTDRKQKGLAKVKTWGLGRGNERCDWKGQYWDPGLVYCVYEWPSVVQKYNFKRYTCWWHIIKWWWELNQFLKNRKSSAKVTWRKESLRQCWYTRKLNTKNDTLSYVNNTESVMSAFPWLMPSRCVDHSSQLSWLLDLLGAEV